jgi:hypothetical protein
LGKGFYSLFHIDDLNGWEVGIFVLCLWGFMCFSVVCLEWFWGSALVEAMFGGYWPREKNRDIPLDSGNAHGFCDL